MRRPRGPSAPPAAAAAPPPAAEPAAAVVPLWRRVSGPLTLVMGGCILNNIALEVIIT
jgi:hypothetical protein